MVSKFNINNFITDIHKRGVVRNHSFVVDFTVPDYLKSSYANFGSGSTQDLISLRCESTQLPGLTFASNDLSPRYNYGPVEINPYMPVYNNIPMTFIMDKGTNTYRFFADWMACIVNYKNPNGNLTQGANFGKTADSVSAFMPYEVGYKDRYYSDMTVHVFSSEGKEIMKCKLMRAFPRVMQPVDLNWNNEDIMKLPVLFSYREHIII